MLKSYIFCELNKQTSLLQLYFLKIIFICTTVHSATETLDPVFPQVSRYDDVQMFSDDIQDCLDDLVVQSPDQTLQDVPGSVQARGQFNNGWRTTAWLL